jgi:DnaJ-class molecular chaperone
MANCPNCNGVGEIEGPPGAMVINSRTKTCPMCNGSGEVSPDVPRWWSVCPRCRGWGEVGMQIMPQTCPTCNGRGMISRGRRKVI